MADIHVPWTITAVCGTKDNIPKAGGRFVQTKSHYAAQVGEVQNLYKTTKPSTIAFHDNLSGTWLTLYLHGYIKIDALTELDKSLKIAVDTAMQGSYPSVQSATTVCVDVVTWLWARPYKNGPDPMTRCPTPRIKSSRIWEYISTSVWAFLGSI